MEAAADLLFDLEDGESLLASDCQLIKMPLQDLEALTRRLELAARQPSEFAKKLHGDVIVLLQDATNEKAMETTAVRLLAAKLASHGYSVGVRVALGGGPDYFRSLRHEFLVVRGTGDYSGMEFIVEPSLRQHFTIPHPSPEYAFILGRTPDVFVGGSCRLVSIVQLLCALMAESFERQGLALPPWRKEQAMLSKWLPNHSRVLDMPIVPQPSYRPANPGEITAAATAAAAWPCDGCPQGYPVVEAASHHDTQYVIASNAASGADFMADSTMSTSTSASASPSARPPSAFGSVTLSRTPGGNHSDLSPVSVMSPSVRHAALTSRCAGGVAAVVKVTGFAVEARADEQDDAGRVSVTGTEKGVGPLQPTGATPAVAGGCSDYSGGIDIFDDDDDHDDDGDYDDSLSGVTASAPHPPFKAGVEYDTEIGGAIEASNGTLTAALRLMPFEAPTGPDVHRAGPDGAAGTFRPTTMGALNVPGHRLAQTGMRPSRVSAKGLLSAKLLMLLQDEASSRLVTTAPDDEGFGRAAEVVGADAGGAGRRLERRAPVHPYGPSIHLVRLGWPSAAAAGAAAAGGASAVAQELPRWQQPLPRAVGAERAWLPWAVTPQR